MNSRELGSIYHYQSINKNELGGVFSMARSINQSIKEVVLTIIHVFDELANYDFERIFGFDIPDCIRGWLRRVFLDLFNFKSSDRTF